MAVSSATAFYFQQKHSLQQNHHPVNPRNCVFHNPLQHNLTWEIIADLSNVIETV